MTERDLNEYLRHKNKIKRLYAEYKECEAYMCAPRAPDISASPGGGGGDGMEKLFDRRNNLMRKIEQLAALRDIAERRLDRAVEVLEDDLQIDVFDCLYRKGLDISVAAKALNYSSSWIYQQRRVILKLVRDIPA